MKKLLLFILLVPVLLSAQTGDTISKNSVFFEFSYFQSGAKNQIYKINYYRILLNKEFVKLSLGAGWGIYGEALGEAAGLFPQMNTSLYFKSFFGRDKHLGFIGAGGSFSPYYLGVTIHLPVGYQFKLAPRLSGFISHSQFMMAFNGETTWIWETKHNTFTIDAGLGMNF